MTRKRPIFVFARLAADDAASDGPKWVQVARAGTFKGYAGGELEFTLDHDVFEQVVANFRRHPSFTAGADGKGVSDVIAWDFNHASEHPATSGVLPQTGAPAQGWVLDLEIRTGADGNDELWALTRWLEPARSYIKEERYRWASISIVFDAVDPVTGEEVGSLLTSIALTNTPFIEGMQPLAASRGYFFEPAKSVDDAIGCMRTMLGLPTLASNKDVQAELAKLRSCVEMGAKVPGEDCEEMVGSLRTILGLPALTSAADVFAKCDEMFSSVTDSGRTETAMSHVAPSTPIGATAQNPKQEDDMDLIKLLAAKFGCKETESAVLEAAAELVELRDGAKAKLGADKASTKAILDKAEEVVAAIIASKKTNEALEQILRAAGVEDVKAGIEKIADLMKSASDLEKAMPELKRLKKLEEDREEAAVEEDVAAAMSAQGLPESMRPALVLYRKGNPTEFATKFPRVPADKAHLTAPVAGKGSGTEGSPAAAALAAGSIDVSSYPGANRQEKAFNFVLATVEGAKSWTYDQQWTAALKLARQRNVVSE